MNAIRTLLAVATLATLTPAAFAGSTVELSVSGTIVPSACTPTMSAADINFGKLSSADLHLDKPTAFLGGRHQSTLKVNCDAATLYGLRGIDNRAATVGNTWYMTPYGIGLTPSGEKLGAHYLEVFPTRSTIDNKPAFVSVGSATGTGWNASTSDDRGIRNFGPLLGFTDTVGVTTGPIPIKDAEYGLEHYLVFAPAKGLTLTDEVKLDGSAVIEVVYL